MLNKKQIIKEGLSIFINKEIPDNIFEPYFNNQDSTYLQEFVLNNLKPGVGNWITGIGIIEAVELIYESAVENGNIK
jgi:hypothetical protein